MSEEKRHFKIGHVCMYGILLVAVLVSASAGYLYNNASTQSRDIEKCQSVGADWYYNGFNQVLCTKKKPQCKEYHLIETNIKANTLNNTNTGVN